jgi:hypothetical protein
MMLGLKTPSTYYIPSRPVRSRVHAPLAVAGGFCCEVDGNSLVKL